ncbi:MAG: LysM peptidoglycan-binding domain-containing protein [Candidatus Omnitrophica bacterium]|nr:LysM peptidoglycan-binding domain-containing protein [Candidatus Omnitrophota bacterium]
MLNKNFILIILSVFAAGCGLEAHTYVMNKNRVGYDQIKNGGCLEGKCPQVEPAEKTRKIYVLEVTKPVPESEVRKIEESAVNAITDTTAKPPASGASAASEPAASAPAASAPAATTPAVVVPVVGDQPAPAAVTGAQNGGNLQADTYTVQKDDTLQKISKKLFGSYGKWYKIYEANKDKIKNPNFVKPGTVLTIPAVK